MNEPRSLASSEASSPPALGSSSDAPPQSPAARGDLPLRQNSPTAGSPAQLSDKAPTRASRRRWPVVVAVVVVLLVGGYFAITRTITALNTISTDDAYINGHVTFVAARVPGQVMRVLVDDNNRVRKGDLLVQLDKEPYNVQVAIKQAAVAIAETDLDSAQAKVRGLVAQTRSNRYRLEHAMEDVRNQVALLKANVAKLKAEQADQVLAEADYERFATLVGKGAVSQQEFDQHRAARDVARNRVSAADQNVQQTRASLGLPVNHENPLDVPSDLDQNFSTVRQALASLLDTAAQIGYSTTSWDATPKQAVEEFYKQDPQGNLDRIYAHIIPQAPAVKQANARVLQARRDLEQAELNLRYCDVISEIDGVVVRRNVNPGNNVQAGQSLMAVRSVTEIWVDANFKETQLARLRIGQRVLCEVDMYGRRHEFEGRITGFTMGTGQTLALLPAQNATGNFVKIVQRLPVRIDLTNYDPAHDPLFVGLSVVPYVYYKEPPTGPHAGNFLQPFDQLPSEPSETKP